MPKIILEIGVRLSQTKITLGLTALLSGATVSLVKVIVGEILDLAMKVTRIEFLTILRQEWLYSFLS